MPEYITRTKAAIKYGALAALFALLGIIVYVPETTGGGGGGTTTSTTLPTTTVKPTTTVSSTTTTVVVPPSGKAAWTTPLAAYTVSSRSTEWARRLWLADTSGTRWFPAIGFQSDSNDYSIPVYYSNTATTTKRVFRKDNFNGVWNVPRGSTIPWNPAWIPSRGKDGFMIVLNTVTGEEFDLWAISDPGGWNPSYNSTNSCSDLGSGAYFANAGAGYNPSYDLCAASVMRITSPPPFNAAVDYRTYTGNFPGASGGGLQNTAGLITPAQVKAGKVTSAAKTIIPNTMFGPACTQTEQNDSTKYGITCGTAVAPAGQFERFGVFDDFRPGTNGNAQLVVGANATEKRSNSVFEGTRFGLKITDAEINVWLDSFVGQSARLRETRRVFAVGFRDYGWLITDSGNSNSVLFQGDGSTAARTEWESLGVTTAVAPDLFKGLFTQARIVAYDPPEQRCGDGSWSRFYCHATETR